MGAQMAHTQPAAGHWAAALEVGEPGKGFSPLALRGGQTGPLERTSDLWYPCFCIGGFPPAPPLIYMSQSFVEAGDHGSPPNSVHKRWLYECSYMMFNRLKSKEVASKAAILLLFLEPILLTEPTIKGHNLGPTSVSNSLHEPREVTESLRTMAS